MSTLVENQTEQISFDKPDIEFMYSVAVTSVRLIKSDQSQTAKDIMEAWQRVAEIIAAKGDVSVSDIGIATS